MNSYRLNIKKLIPVTVTKGNRQKRREEAEPELQIRGSFRGSSYSFRIRFGTSSKSITPNVPSFNQGVALNIPHSPIFVFIVSFQSPSADFLTFFSFFARNMDNGRIGVFLNF